MVLEVLHSWDRVINFIVLTYELEFFNAYSVSRAWNTEPGIPGIPFRKNVICAWFCRWFSMYFSVYICFLICFWVVLLCCISPKFIQSEYTYRNAAYSICCSIFFCFHFLLFCFKHIVKIFNCVLNFEDLYTDFAGI